MGWGPSTCTNKIVLFGYDFFFLNIPQMLSHIWCQRYQFISSQKYRVIILNTLYSLDLDLHPEKIFTLNKIISKGIPKIAMSSSGEDLNSSSTLKNGLPLTLSWLNLIISFKGSPQNISFHRAF